MRKLSCCMAVLAFVFSPVQPANAQDVLTEPPLVPIPEEMTGEVLV